MSPNSMGTRLLRFVARGLSVSAHYCKIYVHRFSVSVIVVYIVVLSYTKDVYLHKKTKSNQISYDYNILCMTQNIEN